MLLPLSSSFVASFARDSLFGSILYGVGALYQEQMMHKCKVQSAAQVTLLWGLTMSCNVLNKAGILENCCDVAKITF